MNIVRYTFDTHPENHWSEARIILFLRLEQALLGCYMWWSRCPPVKNEPTDIDSMYLTVDLKRSGFSLSGGELRMAGSMWSSDGSGIGKDSPDEMTLYAMSFLSD